MATYFGKTWWGEKWLDALKNIDYSNRLPRGASYAKNGLVKDLTIDDDCISAKVQGRQARPYKVQLKLTPIKRNKINRLTDEIRKRPTLLSKLIARELDPEILTICQQLGITIFPKSWRDLQMSCSCPDWAVPCKHIAATIYMLSKEIDNNPFLVFRIHGIDLLKELQQKGVNIEVGGSMEPEKLESLLDEQDDTAKTPTDADAPLTISVADIPDIRQPLVDILPKQPPFCNRGDFSAKYETGLSKIARKAKKVINGKMSLENPDILKPEINRFTDLHITTDHNFDVLAKTGRTPLPLYLFFPSLADINPEELDLYTPTVVATWHALFLSLHLLAKGAVTPRIVEVEKGKHTVIWHPAMIDKNVTKCVHQLQRMMPEELMMAKKPKQRKPQAIGHSAYWLLSALLTELSDIFTLSCGDELTNIFFKKVRMKFDRIGYKETPGNIKTWLDRFYLNTDDTKLELRIDDEETRFALSLYIIDGNTTRSMKDIFQSQEPQLLTAILKRVAMLYNVVPGLERYIDHQAKSRIFLSHETFANFLFNSLPVIHLLGVNTVLPKSLAQLIKPKITGRVTRNGSSMGQLRMDDLLQFDWQVALGDTVISPADFATLAVHAEELIKFKGKYIYATKEDLEKLQKLLQQPPRLSTAQILQTALSGDYGGAKVQLTDEVTTLMRQLSTEETTPLPRKLHATLRPYQKRGYSWMYRNTKLGFGSLIADDMGLGKTLQVIALLLKLKEEGALDKEKIAIIVPTGLITNWESELTRFAPSLTYHVYHGPERDIHRFAEDILLTSYGVARSDHNKLEKIKWHTVVIDEAQNIKNNATRQSKAVKALGARIHIAMSGTPVENRLSEYWSIMDFTNHGLLGTASTFEDDFAKRIQRFGDTDCANRLKRITAPFILRRLKTDKTIISDLPDKIERDEFAVLQPEQAALYHKTVEEAMAILDGMDGEDAKSLFKRTGIILQMMLALKQICNHPALFLKNDQRRVEQSGKTLMLIDTLRSIVESKEKVLVFTQFAEMGNMLCEMIEEQLGERPLFYHGGLSLKQRNTLVQQFQNDKRQQIFILTLKSAGTGLNLTAATHVIHFDLWWNPAVEAQATDRAYRIGQHSNVQVHRFITRHSFEEKINQMIQDKKHLADMTVATGENWIGKLSNEELKEIFS